MYEEPFCRGSSKSSTDHTEPPLNPHIAHAQLIPGKRNRSPMYSGHYISSLIQFFPLRASGGKVCLCNGYA